MTDNQSGGIAEQPDVFGQWRLVLTGEEIELLHWAIADVLSDLLVPRSTSVQPEVTRRREQFDAYVSLGRKLGMEL